MTKCLFSFFFLCSFLSKAQTYEMKVPQSIEKKEALLKILKDEFTVSPELNYTISTYDLSPVFDSIPINTVYDDKYLQTVEDSLAVAPKNPTFLNQAALYCQYHGLDDMAKSYFEKTLDNLTTSYFDEECDMLAFRGTLKLNINPADSTALTDFKRAMEAEETDSSYFDLYVYGLMSFGKIEEIKTMIYDYLETDNLEHAFGHIYLYYTDILFPIMTLNQDMYSDSIEFDKSIYRKQHYLDILDMSQIDAFTKKHEHLEHAETFHKFFETSLAMIKVLFFDIDKDYFPIMTYSKKEKKDIRALIAYFEDFLKRKQLNQFTLHKTLGILYFLLEEHALVEKHLTLATQLFQKDRISNSFSPNESYMALSAMYYMTKQYAKFESITKKAIEYKPLGKPYHKYDNMLATHYLKTNRHKEAYQILEKSLQYGTQDFLNLRLYSFLNYIQGYNTTAEKYLIEAGNLPVNSDQLQAIYIQASIYQLDVGNAEQAHTNLVLAKESSNGDCQLCDQLINDYILIKE